MNQNDLLPATNGELVTDLVEKAKEYSSDALGSLQRNQPLHQHPTGNLPQVDIDAILVDFVNYVAYQRGIDLAFKREDLAE